MAGFGYQSFLCYSQQSKWVQGTLLIELYLPYTPMPYRAAVNSVMGDQYPAGLCKLFEALTFRLVQAIMDKDKRMKKLTLTLCILTLGSSTAYATSADLTGDAAAGKTKSATCTACHGADGNSINPLWPNLAGQHASVIVQQLENFQSAARQDGTMTPMAMPLSTQDMHDLAAYFASQTTKIGEASAETLELGQKIYRGGNKETSVPACIACHGPQGEGNPAAKYPSVSGQQAEYTKKQLMDYKSGARKPEGNAIIMRDIASKMSDDEMKAVADYMQGLY
jgi:cytochrome c553